MPHANAAAATLPLILVTLPALVLIVIAQTVLTGVVWAQAPGYWLLAVGP